MGWKEKINKAVPIRKRLLIYSSALTVGLTLIAFYIIGVSSISHQADADINFSGGGVSLEGGQIAQFGSIPSTSYNPPSTDFSTGTGSYPDWVRVPVLNATQLADLKSQPGVKFVTPTSDWRGTIRNASPGDVIVLRNGTYTAVGDSQRVQLPMSGTANAPVSILAETTGGVTINFTGADFMGYWEEGVSPDRVNYVRMVGFKINGGRLGAIFLQYARVNHLTIQDVELNGGGTIDSGINMSAADNIIISGVNTYNYTENGILLGIKDQAEINHAIIENTSSHHNFNPNENSDGIGIENVLSEDIVIRDTTSYSNGADSGYDIKPSIRLMRSIAHSNTANGFKLWRGSDIISSLSYGNGEWEMQFDGSQNSLQMEYRVYGTTIIGSTECAGQAPYGGFIPITIRNSIMGSMSRGSNFTSTVDSAYSVYTTTPFFAIGTGSVVAANPLFVNAAANNYHLQSGSPAVSRGTTLGEVVRDLELKNRSVPYDAGAFEYEAGTSNNPPVLNSIGNKSATVGTNLSFNVTASDPDGDTVTITASGLPTGATFNGSAFSWTPASNQVGGHNVTFTASDGSLTDAETITITVASGGTGNNPPVLAAIGNKTINENANLAFTISATDADTGDTLTYSASGLPSGATFNASTRTFSWTPSYTQAGAYNNVHFEVTDGQATDSENISITVNNVNRAPVLAAIGNKTVNENANLTFTISATDPDSDTLTYSASNLPSGATFNASTRVFSFTPNYSQAGVFNNVHFQVSDGQTANPTDSEDISITVNNVNRAPVLDPIGNKTVTAGQLLQFTVAASDPDGDALSFRALNLPSGASFNTSTHVFSWTPTAQQVGSYPAVRFEVTDAAGGFPAQAGEQSFLGKVVSFFVNGYHTVVDFFGNIIEKVSAQTSGTDYEEITITVQSEQTASTKRRPDGTLLKANNSATVYLLENGQRREIKSWSIFASQFHSSRIITISPTELNVYGNGSPLKYQDGTLFVGPIDPTTYVVEAGQKKPFSSDSVFASMGYKRESIIKAESQDVVDLHSTGSTLIQASTHPNGTLIKSSSNATVYYLENGQKRPVTAGSIYTSRFIDWSKIVTVNDSELNSYTTGSNLPYREGTIFAAPDGKVYIVVNSQRRYVKSAQLYFDLGYNFNYLVRAESTVVVNLHSAGSDLAYLLTHPNGTLIKANNSGAVYLLENGQKREIKSWTILISQFNPVRIVTALPSELDSYANGSPLKYHDGTIFRVANRPEIYVVENGNKRPFPSASIYEGMGYSWKSIYTAESQDIADLHPTGNQMSMSSTHPTGTFIKSASNPNIYYLENGQKRPVISASIFISRFTYWNKIVIVSDSELNGYTTGSNFPYREGTIFAVPDGKVYIVVNNQRRYVSGAQLFFDLGYSFDYLVKAESTSVVNLHAAGSDINFYNE